MTGFETIVAAACLSLIGGGVIIAKHYISEKSKEKNIALAESMCQEETKRLKIVTDALRQPRLEAMQQDLYVQAGNN